MQTHHRGVEYNLQDQVTDFLNYDRQPQNVGIKSVKLGILKKKKTRPNLSRMIAIIGMLEPFFKVFPSSESNIFKLNSLKAGFIQNYRFVGKKKSNST